MCVSKQINTSAQKPFSSTRQNEHQVRSSKTLVILDSRKKGGYLKMEVVLTDCWTSLQSTQEEEMGYDYWSVTSFFSFLPESTLFCSLMNGLNYIVWGWDFRGSVMCTAATVHKNYLAISLLYKSSSHRRPLTLMVAESAPIWSHVIISRLLGNMYSNTWGMLWGQQQWLQPLLQPLHHITLHT